MIFNKSMKRIFRAKIHKFFVKKIVCTNKKREKIVWNCWMAKKIVCWLTKMGTLPPPPPPTHGRKIMVRPLHKRSSFYYIFPISVSLQNPIQNIKVRANLWIWQRHTNSKTIVNAWITVANFSMSGNRSFDLGSVDNFLQGFGDGICSQLYYVRW